MEVKNDELYVDDKKMKVDENSKFSKFFKTKSVLDNMIAERKKNRTVSESPEINQIFKDLHNKRHR